jgi:hypothetical protein
VAPPASGARAISLIDTLSKLKDAKVSSVVNAKDRVDAGLSTYDESLSSVVLLTPTLNAAQESAGRVMNAAKRKNRKEAFEVIMIG